MTSSRSTPLRCRLGLHAWASSSPDVKGDVRCKKCGTVKPREHHDAERLPPGGQVGAGT